MMESGREHNVREGIEAGVRIPVLMQKKHEPVLQGDDAATDSHRDIVEVPESLGVDSARAARVSCLTIAVVKNRRVVVMRVRHPPGLPNWKYL